MHRQNRRPRAAAQPAAMPSQTNARPAPVVTAPPAPVAVVSEPQAYPSAWRNLFPGIVFRTLASGPDTLVTSLQFERGAVTPLHRHASTQAGYVQSGRVRVTTPDEQYVVSAGESYVIEANSPHQVRALTPALVVDTFSGTTAALTPPTPASAKGR